MKVTPPRSTFEAIATPKRDLTERSSTSGFIRGRSSARALPSGFDRQQFPFPFVHPVVPGVDEGFTKRAPRLLHLCALPPFVRHRVNFIELGRCCLWRVMQDARLSQKVEQSLSIGPQ